MQTKHIITKQLASAACIAALYTALSMVIPSYGVLQLRLGECLAVLAAFSPMAVAGLTAGCLLTNLIGLFCGLTILPDVLFGTLATLLGGIGSYLLRRVTFKEIPLLIWLPPVIANGLLVGFMLDAFYELPTPFLATAGTVALQEAIPCLLLGLPLFLLCRRVQPVHAFLAPQKGKKSCKKSAFGVKNVDNFVDK